MNKKKQEIDNTPIEKVADLQLDILGNRLGKRINVLKQNLRNQDAEDSNDKTN